MRMMSHAVLGGMAGTALVVLAGACESDDVIGGPATVASSSAASSSGAGGSGGATGGSAGMNVGGCEANCQAQYGEGAETLAALESCIYCSACFDLCEAEGYCPNGGREAGCSARHQDCLACAYSTCSWSYDGTTFSGTCADEYQACDQSACIDLWECLQGC